MFLKRSDGNALFIILIAVVLFAALTYAITSSSRSKGDIALEKASLEVSRMLAYTASLRATVMRMSVTNGVAGDAVMYNNNVYTNNSGAKKLTLGTPANPAAYVFHPQGGGLTAQSFEAMSSTESCSYGGCVSGGYAQPGHADFYYAKITGVGSDEADVVIVFRLPTQRACMLFNKAVGVGPASGLFSMFIDSDNYQSAAALIAPPSGLADLDAGGEIYATGRMEFCYRSVNASGTGNANTSYNVVSVIWPR